MSAESVRQYFKQYGIEDRIVTLKEDSATVDLAAKALHIDPSEIAKTLSFMVNDRPVLIVMEGTARVDNHLFKDFFHFKASMMKYQELTDLVGHEPGGVCPFGLKEGTAVYLDESLKKHAKVYPAGGSHHTVIAMSLAELEKYSGYIAWVNVCKQPLAEHLKKESEDR